jgi:hypothetical protein
MDLPAKLKANFQQDYHDFLDLVEEYPVHPVDPVGKCNVLPLCFLIDQTGRLSSRLL